MTFRFTFQVVSIPNVPLHIYVTVNGRVYLNIWHGFDPDHKSGVMRDSKLVVRTRVWRFLGFTVDLTRFTPNVV